MDNKLDAKLACELIDKMGLKKTHVASKIGVEPGTLSRFLNGKGRLGKSAMILLRQVLEVEKMAG